MRCGWWRVLQRAWRATLPGSVAAPAMGLLTPPTASSQTLVASNLFFSMVPPFRSTLLDLRVVLQLPLSLSRRQALRFRLDPEVHRDRRREGASLLAILFRPCVQRPCVTLQPSWLSLHATEDGSSPFEFSRSFKIALQLADSMCPH